MNKALQQLLKHYGVKLGNYTNEKNRLFNQGLIILKMVDEYIRLVEKANLTDSSFFLDFENDLNALSVKDHANSNS